MMTKFRIEAQHKLYMTYVVEAETEKQAIEKLQDLQDGIITEYCGQPKTWGLDENFLESEGIVADDSEAWVSCVLPTGPRLLETRSWEIEEMDDE